MVKRILENEKYLGRNGYPAIIDEDMFCRANMRKKIKSTTVAEISENGMDLMTEFDELTFESLVEKIIVKSPNELEFHLYGGLKFTKIVR